MSRIKIKIGLIGGGQLGKMLIEDGQKNQEYDIHYTVLDPNQNCSCSSLANELIIANFYDKAAIETLVKKTDVLSFELENIDWQELKNQIKKHKKRAFPKPDVLGIIQDKCIQKRHFQQYNIPQASFSIINNERELEALPGTKKFVFKLAKGGYDGKGVFIGLKLQLPSNFLKFPLLIEEKLEIQSEIGIMVAVHNNEIMTYPPVEMVFNHDANLLDYQISPTRLSSDIEDTAIKMAKETIKTLNSDGLFAVELILDSKNSLYVNEVAPRPHNSGHHTIEQFSASQYTQLNRILLNQKIELNPKLKANYAAMFNILGPTNFTGKYTLENNLNEVESNYSFIHLYNKEISKPFRKLGHCTILAHTKEEILLRQQTIKEKLKIIRV